MLTRMNGAKILVVFWLFLGLVGCAQSQPSIVGKWYLATQGGPGTLANLAAEQIEVKSDGAYNVYDIGKYSVSGNILKYVRKTGTEYTYTITLEAGLLKGFQVSEFKRVSGDAQTGIVGVWERVPTASSNYNQIEFKLDGTYAKLLPGTYTLVDSKTIQVESLGGNATQAFILAGDSLTLGTDANALQYTRIK